MGDRKVKFETNGLSYAKRLFRFSSAWQLPAGFLLESAVRFCIRNPAADKTAHARSRDLVLRRPANCFGGEASPLCAILQKALYVMTEAWSR